MPTDSPDATQSVAHVRSVLRWIASRKWKGRGRFGGYVMWSVVGRVFSLGSTSATELCEQYGFDPNQKVRDVKW